MNKKVTLAFMICVVSSLASCRALFSDDDYFRPVVSQERLREIDAIMLAEKSTTPPVTIADATDEALQQALQMPTPDRVVELSLADVRLAALENNLNLQAELFNPTIAETSVDEEQAKFEWLLRASYGRDVRDSPTTVSTIGTESTTDQTNLGVTIPNRLGGTINVDLPITRQNTNNPFATLPTLYDTDLRFSISQPLLRNAGPYVNTHSIRVAKYQSQITTALTKLEAIRILANADRAYWLLYAAQRQLDVRLKQYELAIRQLEQAQRKVDAGDVAEIEIIRAQSGVASRLEAIIVADTLIKTRQRDLKRILNRPDLPINTDAAILISTEPNPLGLELPRDELADFAVENRMEMLEQELRLAIDTSTVDFQRNAKLPLVTLDYVYNINGLDDNLRGAVGQIPDRDFEDWSVGFSAQIPLGNEAAEARYHRAVVQRLQRLATIEQRDQSIREEVYDALDALEQNWQRILAARQEVILAGRTYEAEQRQFDVGIRTSTDVLDAAADLADAQSREIQALADYEISLIDIAFATGTLLGRNRVVWEPQSVDDQ